ncbi:hypothetical protein IPM62_01225 [Candidatus Woesebacteria bacterium]|nr:MAG: hypothetical protein IPM62_01225 [Candidatus Woesebacteria bacterium]
MLGVYLQKDLRDPNKDFIPTEEDFIRIKEGNIVEVVFENDEQQIERMPVKITNVQTKETPRSYTGTVYSNPQVLRSPKLGEIVTFRSKHISNIYPED